MMLRAFLLAGLGAAVALPALARMPDDADRAEVAALVERFETAFDGGDMAAVIEAIPPRAIEAIAQGAGAPPEELREVMLQQMNAMMGGVEVLDYGMDLDAATAAETSSGRPYLLIPTGTTMKVADAGTFRNENTTLALEDDGEWYVMRVDDENQVALLRQVYPDFAGIDFPIGVMEQVE